jgi:PUB domain
VEQAAELLLLQGQSDEQSPPPQQQRITASSSEAISHSSDDDIARALRESRLEEEQRQLRRALNQSAASKKAGAAAVSRDASPSSAVTTKSGLAVTHPGVKMVPKLADKSVEEQVLRSAQRLAPHPAAVDTLLRALCAVQADPDAPKFRRIDTSSVGYQRSVASAPGSTDFLQAMNYQPQGQFLILERCLYDPALMYLGVSALEQIKLSPEYRQAKAYQVFEKEVQAMLNDEPDEMARRAEYLASCPTEPPAGRGALMTVNIASHTLRRRFDGDDTLADVLNWLGAQASGLVPRLLDQSWSLVDQNRFPVSALDCVAERHATLQYLGCWPSGKLQVVPEEWRRANQDSGLRGSSRGLGAGPSHGR